MQAKCVAEHNIKWNLHPKFVGNLLNNSVNAHILTVINVKREGVDSQTNIKTDVELSLNKESAINL